MDEGQSARVDDRVLTMIKEIEGILRDGLRKFPGDSHLLALESQFAKAMDDEPRATAAMEKAVEHNPDDGLMVRRLARHYAKKGDAERASAILSRCLDASPTDQKTAFQLARTLDRQGQADKQAQIRMLLRRSFTPGDSNYEEQFWYAKHEFLYGDADAAEEAFDRLKAANVPFSDKRRIRGEVSDEGGSPTVLHWEDLSSVLGILFREKRRCANGRVCPCQRVPGWRLESRRLWRFDTLSLGLFDAGGSGYKSRVGAMIQRGCR